MPDIAIDVGNTNIKAAIFYENGKIEYKSNLKEFDIISLVNTYPEARVIIALVGPALVNFVNLVTNKERVHFLDENLRLPIINKYRTPSSLGADRLASVCGAWDKMPNKNCLVIDIGTCITYDLIEDTGIYRGGTISPGMKLRFQSLNMFTSRLPLLSYGNSIPELLGTDTEGAIKSGVLNGLVFEINGVIDAFKALYPNLSIVICGGDATIFENQIKHSIFADPNLVLAGLHAILMFNYS